MKWSPRRADVALAVFTREGTRRSWDSLALSFVLVRSNSKPAPHRLLR